MFDINIFMHGKQKSWFARKNIDFILQFIRRIKSPVAKMHEQGIQIKYFNSFRSFLDNLYADSNILSKLGLLPLVLDGF